MKKIFIKATEEYSTIERHIPAPLFRKSFVLKSKPEKATVSVVGLGFYELYINGARITKGHIAPYVSNPDHLCYLDEYRVEEYLAEGKNVIGLMLGNGMNNAPGGAVWDFDLAEFRSAPRVALEFECEELSFNAGDGFLTHPSHILFDDLRLGEICDMRLMLPGWSLPDFDDKDWKPALKAETPRGRIKKCTAEPIKVMEELAPISIHREGDAFIYDFGKNTAGVPRLRIKGDVGQRITLWHGEALDKNGKFYNDNIRFFHETRKYYDEYNQTDRITLSGGDDEYIPTFTYHGFRYIKVEGLREEQATKDILTYLVMSSNLTTVGGFSCSDERINKIYGMVDNANRSNFYYFPTDCPHREKNGWTGDAAISAEQMTLQYDTEASYGEWLTSIRLAMNERGELPGIVPTTGWGFAWGNGPTWDQVLFRLPYVTYKFRGTTELIKENAHAMVRYLEYAMTRRSPDGTIAIGFGDWVPVNKNSSDYDAPLALTDSVAVMEMARAASEMLSAIGHTHSANFAEAIYRDMRSAIRGALVCPDMSVKGKCQSAQAIALYYGVFDECEKQKAFSHLLTYIHEKDDKFDCGFIGMHCLFSVLADMGEAELAFKMMTGKEFPSYTLLIEEGYTALPEKFHTCGGGTYDLSMNHHFLGDISRWLTTRLAGLDVIDHKTVRIKPHPVSGIDSASAYYILPSGKAQVFWQRGEGGEIKLEYSVPEGVTVLR